MGIITGDDVGRNVKQRHLLTKFCDTLGCVNTIGWWDSSISNFATRSVGHSWRTFF